MAQTIQLKRSAVAGKVPTTSDLSLGELALNTYDGKLYTKKDNGTASIVQLSGGGASVTTSDTAPASPEDGDLWYDSVGGRLYVYYADPSGSQWVDASPQGGSALTSISSDVDNTATGYFDLPSGTTAQRPGTPNTGMIRYNSTLGCLESYVQSAWQVIANTALDYGLITSAADTTFDYGALS